MPSDRRQVAKVGVVDFGIEEAALPNGTHTELAIIRHPGGSAVVALDNGGRVTMLSQYRHAIGGYIWEIPAGVRGAGESAIRCAQRELAEEAGLSARRWDQLGTIFTVPSFCDERIDLFLARELETVAEHRGEDEVLRIERIPLAETLRMIRRGDIADAKTIAALHATQDFLRETAVGTDEF